MTTNLTKDVVIQYVDLIEETKELRRRIDTLEKEIKKMEKEGSVIDCVKGGEGGIQNFKVEGFPVPAYSRKKTLLYIRKANLEALEMEKLELVIQAEEYINSIADARMRRLLNLKIIEGLTYMQVAAKMGRRATPDSIRMEVNRFFENK